MRGPVFFFGDSFFQSQPRNVASLSGPSLNISPKPSGHPPCQSSSCSRLGSLCISASPTSSRLWLHAPWTAPVLGLVLGLPLGLLHLLCRPFGCRHGTSKQGLGRALGLLLQEASRPVEPKLQTSGLLPEEATTAVHAHHQFTHESSSTTRQPASTGRLFASLRTMVTPSPTTGMFSPSKSSSGDMRWQISLCMAGIVSFKVFICPCLNTQSSLRI